MPEPYTSYEAKVSQVVTNGFANSATFRALVGAADATAARAFIVENTGGTPDESGDGTNKNRAIAVDGSTVDTLAAHVCFAVLEVTQEQGHAMTYRARAGDVVARLIIPDPTPAPDTPADRFRYVQNVVGGIKVDLVAQQGSPGFFIVLGIDSEITALRDPASDRITTSEAELILNWSDL